MGMKYKDPDTGQLKELSLKAADTLPVGTIVDYDGEDVPEGWEKYGTDDYSTEETFTGKHWIDGKPIYRKVIEMNSVASSGTGTYDISNLNIDEVWVDLGHSFYKSGTTVLPLNRTHIGTIGNQSEIRVSATAITLICGSGIAAQDPIVTIEYTKTTD